jgi:hypothetical protein
MITLTITAENPADLQTQLAAMLQRNMVAAATIADGPDTVAGTETTAVAGNGAGEPGAATSSKATGRGKAAPKAAGAAAKAKESVLDKKLDRSDVRAALTNYLALNDEPATAALLKRFGGVEKLSELSEDRFQAVYDAAIA